MKIIFRVTSALLARIRDDLSRPHHFAAERVGYGACKIGTLQAGNLLILASNYSPVADDDYLDDPYAGATIGEQCNSPGNDKVVSGAIINVSRAPAPPYRNPVVQPD